MTIVNQNDTTIEACDGNKAAAYGALLSRPDVIAIYPITPQTNVIESLSRFHDQGILDAELVHVEGENSAMGIVMAASVAGGRVFTATSSWGLTFMYDGLMFTAGNRVPVVMVNVNREPPGSPCVASSNQDMMSVRDSGWIQIDVETCQEILDVIIMAYKIAEDPEILIPFMVCYDGFYLSYLVDRVQLPAQSDVDEFLRRDPDEERIKLTMEPGQYRTFGAHCGEVGCAELRYKHCVALEKVKQKVEEVDAEFKKKFGRSYGGQIEEYRTEDAEIVLLSMGSCIGTARVAVDRKREEGIKAGLVKLRLLRPFPRERLVEALKDKKAVAVIDRSVCFGWNCGHIYMELKGVLMESGIVSKTLNFIGGLANADITVEQIENIIDLTLSASKGEKVQEITWLTLEGD
jgi:pyruvate/2-oxoacid:ferredoxin oxidoreductase alpha subunit